MDRSSITTAFELPGYRVEQVSTIGNLARPVALGPLIDWLPERARRAEDLEVRRVDPQTYEELVTDLAWFTFRFARDPDTKMRKAFR